VSTLLGTLRAGTASSAVSRPYLGRISAVSRRRYDKLAREDPIFVTPAYAVNQPQTLTGQHLAKSVEENPEEEVNTGR